MVRVNNGLEGVIVAQTVLSDVQAQGVLSYRGHPIEELVSESFERAAHLLLRGELGDGLGEILSAHANLDADEAARVLALPRHLHPMKVLQCMAPAFSEAPALGFGEADQGLYLCAKLPAVVLHHLLGRSITLNHDLPYAARFLNALSGTTDDRHIHAFNTTQILQLEHSLNAGTFAARVVASTLAPVDAAIAAGFGALSGPLHGGADQAVMDIVDELADPRAAVAYVDHLLASGAKLPGMGHREYRVKDPRAVLLEQWAYRLSAASEHAAQYEILVALDERFRQRMQEAGKPLHANVEFYKGLVYRMLGLPKHFFTAGFAMARCFGYVAHFIESRAGNRIFRPAAEYLGTAGAEAVPNG